MACRKHGRDKVIKVIEDTLMRYNYASETPLNIVKALTLAASAVHIPPLDGVYFLFRREPVNVSKTVIGVNQQQ